MANLTPKQEAFCLAYMETGNASEAYRRAYDAGGMKAETINRNAKALTDNSKVATRLSELRAIAQERAMVTVESLTFELEEARQLALREATAAAAVAATMGKAKLHKLLTEQHDHKSSDGSMSPKGGSLDDFYTKDAPKPDAA
jgi:phage terminase small subunit